MADDKEIVDVEEGVEVQEEEEGQVDAGFRLASFPEAVRPLMAEFDLDGSGEISASELAHAAQLLKDSQNANKKLKRLAMVISGLLVLTLGTIFGLVWAVVSALKDSNVDGKDGTGLMTVKGTQQLVTTSSLASHQKMAGDGDDDLMLNCDIGDATLDKMTKVTIVGKTKATLDVLGWARNLAEASDNTDGERVYLFTNQGRLEVDRLGFIYTDSAFLHKIFGVEDATLPLNYLQKDATMPGENATIQFRRMLEEEHALVRDRRLAAHAEGRRLDGRRLTTTAPVAPAGAAGGASPPATEGKPPMGHFLVSGGGTTGKPRQTKPCPAGTKGKKYNTWEEFDKSKETDCVKCPLNYVTLKAGEITCLPCDRANWSNSKRDKCGDPVPSGTIPGTQILLENYFILDSRGWYYSTPSKCDDSANKDKVQCKCAKWAKTMSMLSQRMRGVYKGTEVFDDTTCNQLQCYDSYRKFYDKGNGIIAWPDLDAHKAPGGYQGYVMGTDKTNPIVNWNFRIDQVMRNLISKVKADGCGDL